MARTICRDVHETAKYSGHALKVLEKIRKICMAYPESVEVDQFGHPWFKAGKRPFVVFGHQQADPQIAFATPKADQSALIEMAPDLFFPTPYMHQHGWTSMHIPAKPDWKTIEELSDTAYRNVALKRMLKALDGP